MQRSQKRVVSLFRNKGSQAFSIPKDFEFPGTKVVVRREGNRLIIEAGKRGLEALFASWEPDPDFPDIEDHPV